MRTILPCIPSLGTPKRYLQRPSILPRREACYPRPFWLSTLFRGGQDGQCKSLKRCPTACIIQQPLSSFRMWIRSIVRSDQCHRAPMCGCYAIPLYGCWIFGRILLFQFGGHMDSQSGVIRRFPVSSVPVGSFVRFHFLRVSRGGEFFA